MWYVFILVLNHKTKNKKQNTKYKKRKKDINSINININITIIGTDININININNRNRFKTSTLTVRAPTHRHVEKSSFFVGRGAGVGFRGPLSPLPLPCSTYNLRSKSRILVRVPRPVSHAPSGLVCPVSSRMPLSGLVRPAPVYLVCHGLVCLGLVCLAHPYQSVTE